MLRNATAPSRGGLGKEGKLYAMPRAPLLAGAVAVGDWGVLSAPVPLTDALAPTLGELSSEARLRG